MIPQRPIRPLLLRILAATAAAIAFACGVYLLIESTRPNGGLIGFTFLIVLPAAVCSFVAYVADPWKERSRGDYRLVPIWLLSVVVLASLFLLREGVICILMLAPLWVVSGLVGVEITYRLRRRTGDGRTYCVALVALPLLAMQVEPLVPLPTDHVTVTRSIEIAAPAATIWPMLRGIPDVQPGEGRWTVTQDLIGVPRPVGARLTRDGVGADRHAVWQNDIRFRERIIAWQTGRQIRWSFIFDDIANWAYTDRHLMPDSPYFTVTSGGYRLDPLGPARSRVTIDTRYRITTPVNPYSRLWGELLLGDLENNLLAIIRHRAEAAASVPARGTVALSGPAR